MVEDRITDGKRIAQLLASELDGREDGPLVRIAVVNAREEVDPVEGGARAYDVTLDGSVVASAFVRPEGAYLSFHGDVEAAVEAVAVETAGSAGLCVRRGASRSGASSRRELLVENGAEVKGAVEVVTAVASRIPE